MARRLPPSQRPERKPVRSVLLGVVPGKNLGPTQVGVLIRSTTNGSHEDTVIHPDEARSFASTEADPKIKADLLRIAAKVDEVLHELKNERGEHVEIVAPKITGPEALKWWVEQYRQHFRKAYQTALDAGWQSDLYLLATPTSETLDDPPGEISPVARSNRGFITRPVQSIRGSLDKAAPPGMFYVVASKESGRFSGTFVGMLPTVDREVTEADVAGGPKSWKR